MLRRSFMRLLGAASAAPLLPAMQAAAPAMAPATGYTRYMCGLAVFHARTRASITAADLITKLRVSPHVAQAMIGEMSVRGVLGPALQSGAMRALSSGQVGPAPQPRRAMRKLADATDALLKRADVPASDALPEQAAPEPAQEVPDLPPETEPPTRAQGAS